MRLSCGLWLKVRREGECREIGRDLLRSIAKPVTGFRFRFVVNNTCTAGTTLAMTIWFACREAREAEQLNRGSNPLTRTVRKRWLGVVFSLLASLHNVAFSKVVSIVAGFTATLPVWRGVVVKHGKLYDASRLVFRLAFRERKPSIEGIQRSLTGWPRYRKPLSARHGLNTKFQNHWMIRRLDASKICIRSNRDGIGNGWLKGGGGGERESELSRNGDLKGKLVPRYRFHLSSLLGSPDVAVSRVTCVRVWSKLFSNKLN